jgi:glucose/arabinose dehydrogenase
LRNSLIAVGVLAVILGGGAAWLSRVDPTPVSIEQYEGPTPTLPDPDPETLPHFALLKTIGWAAGEAPVAAKGLQVTRFAERLEHPRDVLTLPNGDVLVAETDAPPGNLQPGVIGTIEKLMMNIVGAGQHSPDTIVLLRDSKGGAKGDGGTADQRFVLRHAGLESPSGMAWKANGQNGALYIADHNAVLAFPYKLGDTTLAGSPTKLMDLPGGGNHWMRNLLLSGDGKKLYVAVGSSSNIGERGMAAEKGRAAIWEIDLANGTPRQFAGGLRNPNGLAWNPSSGELWTVVNERDQLGPNLPPDYLTNVPVGSQYGWPWTYWKDVVDDRVDAPMPDYMTDYTRKPEYALGPHTAPLGLVFANGGGRLGADFANGAFIARHGSWNRKHPAGYDVVFVKFDDHGNPIGKVVPVLSGFMDGHGGTHGRPVWLSWAKDGALLVSDDTAGIIWRVIAPGAVASAAPKPVVTTHMQPQRDLQPPPEAEYAGQFGADQKVKQ